MWFIGSALVVFLEIFVNIKAPYGRYNTTNTGIPVRIAWFVQELPSFVVPCYLLYSHWPTISLVKFVVVLWFLVHYAQRYADMTAE